MFKKIALIAILATILIAGNLLASETIDLHPYVWAQSVVTWTLYVDGDPCVTHTGNWNNPEPDWAYLSYYIKVDGVVYVSGTFPGSYYYDITVPIVYPTNPDPEE